MSRERVGWRRDDLKKTFSTQRCAGTIAWARSFLCLQEPCVWKCQAHPATACSKAIAPKEEWTWWRACTKIKREVGRTWAPRGNRNDSDKARAPNSRLKNFGVLSPNFQTTPCSCQLFSLTSLSLRIFSLMTLCPDSGHHFLLKSFDISASWHLRCTLQATLTQQFDDAK